MSVFKYVINNLSLQSTKKRYHSKTKEPHISAGLFFNITFPNINLLLYKTTSLKRHYMPLIFKKYNFRSIFPSKKNTQSITPGISIKPLTNPVSFHAHSKCFFIVSSILVSMLPSLLLVGTIGLPLSNISLPAYQSTAGTFSGCSFINCFISTSFCSI